MKIKNLLEILVHAEKYYYNLSVYNDEDNLINQLVSLTVYDLWHGYEELEIIDVEFFDTYVELCVWGD